MAAKKMKHATSPGQNLNELEGQVLRWYERNHIGCASTVSAALFLDVATAAGILRKLGSLDLLRVTDKKIHLAEAREGEHAYELR